MRRFLAALACLCLCLGLCACGSRYSAVPELKLSWGMSREEVMNAGEIRMEEIENDDGVYLSSKKGQKLPEVNGLELKWVRCYFDRDGGLKQVDVKFASEDPSAIYEALKSKYGKAAESGYTYILWELDDVTVVDNIAFGAQGPVSYYAPEAWN